MTKSSPSDTFYLICHTQSLLPNLVSPPSRPLLESLNMYPAESTDMRTQAYSSNLKTISKSVTWRLSSTRTFPGLVTTRWPPYRPLPISKTALEQTYLLYSISRRGAIDCGLFLAKVPKEGTSWSYNDSMRKTWV